MRAVIEHNVDLSASNTLGLACIAERVATPRCRAALSALVRDGHTGRGPLTLLSGGSNLILPERLPGLTLRPAMTQWWIEPRGNDAYVHVGAGVNWHGLVMALAERGWWGLENLALIPGHCGAAPVQNIGAYGVELADALESLTLMHLEDGRFQRLGVDECDFGYRESLFKGELDGRVVITDLTLRVSRAGRARLGYGDLASRLSPTPTPWEVAEAVCAVRREKLPDPAELGNAGSFFKNPVVDGDRAQALRQAHPDMPHFALAEGDVKLAAGWLIDQCGLKGWRSGHFGVHERQALVIVHHGGGSAQELLAVAAQVAGHVRDRFGIELEREPRLAGMFGIEERTPLA